ADTIGITVNAVNDAPVNTVPGALSTGLNTPIVFSGANLIAVSDNDDGGAPIQVDLVVELVPSEPLFLSFK
ncbi:MAG: hypothetical protein ACE5DM_03800, partial [Candidatus Nanoarchaeia archaeon]